MGNLKYQLEEIPGSHHAVNLLSVTFSKYEVNSAPNVTNL